MKTAKAWVGLSLIVALMVPALAFAHAHLHHADPKQDSTVDQAPAKVSLEFSSDLESAMSSVSVKNVDSGADVTDGKATLSEKKNKIEVALKPLDPGTYEVSWNVMTGDTHHAKGSYQFKVKSKAKK